MITLSPTETEIMEVLWQSEGMTNNEVILYFKERGKEWKRQTTNTFLTRLADKGLVTKNGHKYMAACTRAEFEKKWAEDILNSMYGGSLRNFISALNGGRQITEEEVRELEKMIDAKEQEWV